jgi:SWI/SNF-related matrix-associated actin-dependent regulator of chromatin subfamily A member 5
VQSVITLVQPSTGADGESEYADELVSEEDELMSDDDDTAAKVGSFWTAVSVHGRDEFVKGGAGPSPSKLAKMQQSAERQKQKQKRKVAEDNLQVKRREMDKAKASPILTSLQSLTDSSHKMSDAVKRYSYLLGQTDLFKHFVDLKVS